MTLSYEQHLGRDYVDGRVHCYQLVRDTYRDSFGIELRDYAIPSNWNSDELDLIGMIHEREGFEKLPDWSVKTLRPGDILCIAVGRSNPNHLLIYVGANKLIHHPLNQLSREEPWHNCWQMTACYVLRHPAVPDLTPVLPNKTIQELLRERYSPQAEA